MFSYLSTVSTLAISPSYVPSISYTFKDYSFGNQTSVTHYADEYREDYRSEARNASYVSRYEGGSIYGGSGNDTFTGGNGADFLYGGFGNDQMSGGAGNDQLYGEDGNDRMSGGYGDDMLFGGAGSDTLIFGRGDGSRDFGDGGAGNDTFQIGLYGANNRLELVGGAGSDTFDFQPGYSGHTLISDWSRDDILDLRGSGISTIDWDMANTVTLTFFNGATAEIRGCDNYDYMWNYQILV